MSTERSDSPDEKPAKKRRRRANVCPRDPFSIEPVEGERDRVFQAAFMAAVLNYVENGPPINLVAGDE